MPFDLTNLNPAVRFHYTDSDGTETGEWVELRRLTLKETREVRKQCTKRKVEYKNAQRFEVVDFNDDLWGELAWDAMIPSWHILDSDNKEVPCTKENKLLMMLGSVSFLSWVNRCAQQLAIDVDAMKEESEKN